MYESLNPLFYQNDEDRNHYSNKVLFDEMDALKNGNLYVKEYIPYLNYLPKIKNPISEKEKLELEIMSIEHVLLDLKLVIIVKPDHKEYITMYEKYYNKLIVLLRKYNETYKSTTFENGKLNDGYYDYIVNPSPWLGV